MQTKLNLRLSVLALIVLAAAMSRLLPHPPNVTAVGAMALFGGAYFTNRWQSVLMPLLAMWCSDLILNNVIYKAYNPQFTFFTEGAIFIYGGIAIVAILGASTLKTISTGRVIGASLLASLIFYIVSNFGVWVGSNMYPQTGSGLLACYAAGLPFLLNTVLGDLVWCGILFGGFELAKMRIPALSTVKN